MRLLVVLLLFALFGACPARKSTVAEIISEVEALNELVVTHSKPHLGTRAEALERKRRSGGLTIYSPSGNADELSANLDAAEDDGKPDRWQQFKDFRKAMYDAVTSNKAKRAAIGVALFSIGILFPPLEVRRLLPDEPARRTTQTSAHLPWRCAYDAGCCRARRHWLRGLAARGQDKKEIKGAGR